MTFTGRILHFILKVSVLRQLHEASLNPQICRCVFMVSAYANIVKDGLPASSAGIFCNTTHYL